MRVTADDMLKHQAAKLEETWAWTGDVISDCGHDVEIGALSESIVGLVQAASSLPLPQTYSNGRRVKTEAEIVPGLTTVQVWHPDPTAEQPHRWRAQLPSDPGTPSPGMYEVTTDPVAQTIHVRVLGGAA